MFIDTHAHLNFKAFDNDREAIIKKSIGEGVGKIIIVGSSLATSLSSVALASKYPELYASVGVHPHHSGEYDSYTLDKLTDLATNNKVVAIGEIGLDYHEYISETKPGISDPKLQKTAFLEQIKLSQKLSLPVIIHCREAMGDLFPLVAQLKRHDFTNLTGVFHCYSEGLDYAKKIVNLGLFVSFTPIITYPKNDYLREVVRYLPLDLILLETDSPFLPPQEKRGLRNDPTAVKIVAQTISEVKKISLEEVEKTTTQNAERLFKI
ncbi:MAG: hypothetical protein A2802_02665 [Candidatus Woykebacteria bacterium RIFCSPHIGHO2_01_FULL_43_29]|uniref:Hydrolase TatD n=2 Tax=Candidatus Woykeibacteriota TaxID=1817899 RepID=A0A1G1WXX8_9BACT|nr:MAG: hypothetical protein A2802_02665 [Candidatus Woykebacteria bacterium RIFCSPHIGHO2_01_FULL_43_29]OGY29875.1 MAG: hypothetical protein A3J50_03920 [Candidatus Woykebacteria bacterium RIFCSPHIGHO2_02_FULL_43_16b]OGY32564.1 MAG: hypothetical protein A3A61_03200 [Candidatus Woykebacteria bacterium RIFCSPLOWO2_01_FULL_43_14]